MDKVIETERLILREIRLSDAEAMFELDSNPKVMQYLGGETVASVDETCEIIQNIRNQYIKYNTGRFAIELKDSRKFIGWAGLKFITIPENNHNHFYDIGYRIQEGHWRKGYALEAAIAWRDHAFEVMKIPVIYASAHTDNIGSNAILRKIGMQYVSDFYYENLPCHWYELKNPNV